ncbi:beta-mannosidase [Sphingopyxis panaciterrae]|uniref:beta-mannosidase n=1 Tax=Sphingopyxis panaciterrae TaxID=363841 RepID=UPI0014202A86|nr:glycoside hydrolase family 2 protein [Sphingopyxis panaciterrae]NIJ37765.1 beta-mannosidase [Sphingopyxis panaciterrae]
MMDQWNVAAFAPGDGLAAGAAGDSPPPGDWYAVTLPGDIHEALFAAGVVCDPHGEGGEEACAWISTKEWWWRHGFEAASAVVDERLILRFDGLDTFATIYLNGEEIGQSDNMFLGKEIDVTGRVRVGANLLAIRFDPVPLRVEGRTANAWPGLGVGVEVSKRNLVRKAQFGWGWDWGPTLPTVGIWRPVVLQRQRIAAIDALQFRTLTLGADGSAAVCVDAEVEAFAADEPLALTIEIAAPDGAVLLTQASTLVREGDRDVARVAATIAQAQLWWTAELGAQPLYRVTATLRHNGEELDRRELRVGIRTIALDTSPDPDEPGTRFFRFILNGRPVFAKGSCWIPAHSLVGVLTREHYRPLIEATARGGQNMLRVWGGGIYEHDAFYDLCDELGVLVWQDFMFACSLYPEHYPDLVASIEAEVAYQVRRLRHHPALALWCGNNENQFIQSFVNEATGSQDAVEGALFYDKIIPEQVAKLDPAVPYWPGSPFGGPHANSMKEGDLHNWTVWHGLPPVPDDRSIAAVDRSPEGVAYQRYAEDMGRFISEFGIQASPVMETLRRSVPADQLSLKSPALENRIKDIPKNKVDAMIAPVTGLPATLDDYVDFTQIAQAEGLKFGIEHYRRRMPHCSGTLIWQLNDCWPGVSWSLLDFYGFAKAGYHYVRRVYAPLLASFKPLEDGAVELWLTNDRARDLAGDLVVELVDMHVGTVWRDEVAYAVSDNRSRPIWRADAARLGAAPGRLLTVRAADEAFPANRHFFAAIKDLERPHDARPEYAIEQAGPNEVTVTLTASAYLFFVHLLVPSETALFDDNYFDLAAGETRVVTIRDTARPLRAADVTVACR